MRTGGYWTSSQWRTLRLSFATAVVGWGFGLYAPAVMLGVLHRTHGWEIGRISLAMSLHFIAGALVVIRLPEIHRCIGMRGAIALGAGAGAVGTMLWAGASSLAALWPAALVTGLAWALLGAATINAIVSPSFDRDRPRALAFSFNGATISGVVFAPALVAAISGLGPLHGAMLVALGAGLVLLLLLAVSDDRSSQGTMDPSRSVRPALSAAALLRRRSFVTLALSTGLGVFAQIGILTHLFNRLHGELGAGGASLALSLASLGVVVGRWGFAEAFQRFDRRWIGALGFLLQIPGAVTLALATSPLHLMLGALVMGLAAGPMSSLAAVVAQAEHAVEDVPRIVSLATSGNQVGFAAAPLTVGLLASLSGSYLVPYLGMAAVLALAAFILLAGRGAAAASPGRTS